MCIFFPFQVQTVRTHRFCCVIQGKGLREQCFIFNFHANSDSALYWLKFEHFSVLGKHAWVRALPFGVLTVRWECRQTFLFPSHASPYQSIYWYPTTVSLELDIGYWGVRSTDSVSLASFYSRTEDTRMQTNKVPRPHAEDAFVL